MKLKLAALLGGIVLMSSAAAQAAAQDVQYIAHPNSKAPFSIAVRAGDTISVSGQIGASPDGTIPKDMESAARYAMDNVKRALAAAGADMHDVTHCTVMLTDMSQWDSFNRIYVTYFEPGQLPARSAMGVSALALGATVEVECTAYKPRSGK